MDTSATNRRIMQFLTALGEGTLQPRPDFQRRLVWVNRDKVEFIKTVLLGYPFPEVYIAAGEIDTTTGKGKEMLVDGQQRITTLYEYFRGSAELKLPEDVRPYTELSEGEQKKFLGYGVVVRDLGEKPLEEIKEIFQRINSTSYGLNAMEINNARYDGKFKELAVEVAAHEFLEEKRVFTLNDARRMNDVKYCLTLIITIMSTYFNRDKEFEAYLEKYNEYFDEKDKVVDEIEGVLHTIKELGLPKTSRAFKKADFLTLFVEVHRVLYREQKELDVKTTKERLLEFFRSVDSGKDGEIDETSDHMRYYKAALNATNDRSSRITRGEVLRRWIVAR
jgi:uncharacterized protein with ParB-like and HNH nuclease domain